MRGCGCLIALLCLLAMTAVLVYGFVAGDFAKEGKQLLSMPWGIVSLVDLYVGFVLFSGWIVYREKSVLRSVVWVVLMMILAPGAFITIGLLMGWFNLIDAKSKRKAEAAKAAAKTRGGR